ncbi:hypothetical protein EDD11_010094, partial [Mortierella claussenii]
KVSPSDLGPVAFAQLTRGRITKRDMHTKYLAIISGAIISKDSEEKAMGLQMKELWEKEKAALKKYWDEIEPLRRLRTRNVISAAKDSSRLQRVVGRHQLRQALKEVQQNQQEEVPDDNLNEVLNDNSDQVQVQDEENQQQVQQQRKESQVFLASGPHLPSAFIEQCFDDLKGDIVDQLVKVDVPQVPRQEFDLIMKFGLAAASQEYSGFKELLRRSSTEPSGLAVDILCTYAATNALWQSPTRLARNEDSYIKRQRDPLPVPNGYEEVLPPDFFGEIDDLCFVIMEVKKPNVTLDDIQDDTRKLPSMMKIALNMLIHASVRNATVLSFLVNENICEVFSMNLEHEAIYIPKSLGRFKLPQVELDIASLLLALSPLTAAK